MSKWAKFVLTAVVCLGLVLAIAITATIGWRPLIGPRARRVTSRHFESTPARLARGEYIFMRAGLCVVCHSPVQVKDRRIVWPPELTAAGQIFPEKNLPGTIVASNLTPDRETGLGNWSDDEIARAIREGVSRDGRALFPMMPYENFRHMSDEDVASVVVFMRSLPSVRHVLPRTTVIVPVRYLIRNLPQPVTRPDTPDLSTSVKRGEYLFRLSDCAACHTPRNAHGQSVPGMELAGGGTLDGPWGKVAAANITPDETGIGNYTEAMFVEAMRTGKVGGVRALNPVMPWQFTGGLTDQDLSDMYAYLRTFKPVRHYVNNVDAPTLCKKCGLAHGLGSQNNQ